MSSRLLALALVLVPLGLVPVWSSISDNDDVHPIVDGSGLVGEGPFPPYIQTKLGDRLVNLRLTGTAMRKALGIKIYHIASYLDDDVRLTDVDAVVAADVPKQLILVMERDISESLVRRSFGEAFRNNDPKHRFEGEAETFLAHMTAVPLMKGDRVTLTHLPGIGVECRVGDDHPDRAVVVPVPEFAHVVWNVYMGPKVVSPDLRKGLGSRLVVWK